MKILTTLRIDEMEGESITRTTVLGVSIENEEAQPLPIDGELPRVGDVITIAGTIEAVVER